MIRLSAPPLTKKTLTHLRRQQATIDALSSYAAQVDKGKELWGVKESTKDAKAAFQELKDKLAQMSCHGQRCHYCEDSYADEIEHIRPKDLYPERVFDWDNYLYACGPCNGPKNNKFAIINAQQTITDVTRARNAAVTPPQAGESALINPRVEDPLAFLHLDLSQTFYFKPSDELLAPSQRDALRYARAKYTLEVLRLNERPALVEMRRQAYRNYTARLAEYALLSQMSPHAPELEDKLASLGRLSHRAVWESMKRQRELIPRLNQLFALAPSALNA